MAFPTNWNAMNFTSSLERMNSPQRMSLASSASLTRYSQSHAIATPSTFRPIPSLFALLIGINHYKNDKFRPLRGAEADACAFKEYFERCLGAPSNHLRLLLGENATRAGIIQALKDLAEDHRIQSGNPIVIFYAGHGGQVLAEREELGSERKIEMLVPYDCSSEAGQEVPAIPDHTLGALIGQIAKEKGDNIVSTLSVDEATDIDEQQTVIFDCCHSASGTRSLSSGVRSVHLDGSMYKPRADQEICPPAAISRGAHPTPQYAHGGLRSHILLAACRSAEKAVESNGHGNFSAALLRLLWSTPPDQLRYRDILVRMDNIPQQNPQCEGIHRNRLLFTQEDVTGSGTALQQFFNSGEKVKVVASVMNAFNSALHPEPVAQSLTRPEDLRLYVPVDDPFHRLFKLVRERSSVGDHGFNNISVVSNPLIAHIGACMHPSTRCVVFEVLDRRATQYGFKRTFESVSTEPDSVANILSSAGRFFEILKGSSKSTGVASKIHLEFYQLQETSHCHDTGEVVLKPSSPNLFRNGRIEFQVVENNTPYGCKIVNNSPHRFYAYLFYFDFSDLSIIPFYQSHATTQKYQSDFCLKKNGGSLTVGYGSSGVSPLSFSLVESSDTEVGFLKLFVSTKPVDLEFIPQGSPFSNSRKALKVWEGKKGELWDDILIPVILRRGVKIRER